MTGDAEFTGEGMTASGSHCLAAAGSIARPLDAFNQPVCQKDSCCLFATVSVMHMCKLTGDRRRPKFSVSA